MSNWFSSWKRRFRAIKTTRTPAVSSYQPTRRRNKLTWFSSPVLIRNLTLAAAALIVFGTLVFVGVFAYFAKDLPTPDKVVRREGYSTKIYDRNKELLYEVYTNQQRTPVTVDQIPANLKHAVVAIEDKNFYSHNGFDKQSYLRIVWNIITKHRLIGGSTLTQQLVKNVLLNSDRTVTRKLKELILAVQIENRYNKDQIMQMYLNEAPYGGTAWGVATAAQIYFGKNVQDLSLLECSVLAGLPQRPSYYSPLSGTKDAYKSRTKDVLRRMHEENYITKDEEAQALKDLDSLEIKPQLTSIKAPHFTMYVKQQLIDMFGETMVEQGGLQVYTTLDYGLQQKAQASVTEEVTKVANQGIGNGAAMLMDPQNGEILSMVGSKDYFAKDFDGQFNVATQGQRQPGSSIKPVTYAAAFGKGYTPASMIMDVPTQFPGATPDKPYEPKNYDGKFRGPVSLRDALGNSLNIPAVKLLALVGMPTMMRTAYDMGLTTLEPTKDNMSKFGLSLTLGGGEVHLVDMVSAYSAFANGGMKISPVAITRVEDRNGKVIYQYKQPPAKRVLDEGVTFLINHVLSDNNARALTFGPNSALNLGGRPVAVKTGTTNDRKDNWTIGWSNAGIVGVWVGNNDNTSMKSVTSGVTGAAPIWRRIMLDDLTAHPPSDWKIPDNVEVVTVDQISGYPEHDGFPVKRDYALKGTTPALPDPIHQKIKLCQGQNKLATQLDIERNNFEAKEFITPTEKMKLGDLPSWQDQINAWIAGQTDDRFKAPTEYCSSADEIVVGLDNPPDKTNISGNDVSIHVNVVSMGDITKVELYVDGALKETLTDRPFDDTLHLDTGKHTLKAKAYRSDGKTSESGENHIGVGGVKWDDGANPSPTPSSSAN